MWSSLTSLVRVDQHVTKIQTNIEWNPSMRNHLPMKTNLRGGPFSKFPVYSQPSGTPQRPSPSPFTNTLRGGLFRGSTVQSVTKQSGTFQWDHLPLKTTLTGGLFREVPRTISHNNGTPRWETPFHSTWQVVSLERFHLQLVEPLYGRPPLIHDHLGWWSL